LEGKHGGFRENEVDKSTLMSGSSIFGTSNGTSIVFLESEASDLCNEERIKSSSLAIEVLISVFKLDSNLAMEVFKSDTASSMARNLGSWSSSAGAGSFLLSISAVTATFSNGIGATFFDIFEIQKKCFRQYKGIFRLSMEIAKWSMKYFQLSWGRIGNTSIMVFVQLTN
jgi:hypothetical protein